MSEQTMREAKLIQYLNEAYGKERQLETALQAHIEMTTRDSYKKRLQAHLKETKQHARDVAKRIKQLGGAAEEPVAAVQTVVRKGAAITQGPIDMLRGTSEAEKLLKNAKTEFANEAEEIATYTAIEALADAVKDKETAQLAKRIRRDEERMASFLERLIPTLTRAVATSEIPAAERRNGAARSGRSTARGRSRSTASSGARSTSSRSRASGTKSKSGTSRTAASRSASGTSRASGGTRATPKKRATSGTSRTGATRSAASRSASGTSRAAGGTRSTAKRATASSGTSRASSGTRSTAKRATASSGTTRRSTSAGGSRAKK